MSQCSGYTSGGPGTLSIPPGNEAEQIINVSEKPGGPAGFPKSHSGYKPAQKVVTLAKPHQAYGTAEELGRG